MSVHTQVQISSANVKMTTQNEFSKARRSILRPVSKLFALNFYEVIVDEAEGLLVYNLQEIASAESDCYLENSPMKTHMLVANWFLLNNY